MAAHKSPLPLLIPISPAEPLQQLPSIVLGTVVHFEAESGPLIDYPGNIVGPAAARLLVAADLELIERAIAERIPVALVFENGDPSRPLIVGFTRSIDAPREARVDGKRIVLTGEEEIELRCGAASISLKKNGRLVIRGAYVETRAKGTNRIKGGSVQIN